MNRDFSFQVSAFSAVLEEMGWKIDSWFDKVEHVFYYQVSGRCFEVSTKVTVDFLESRLPIEHIMDNIEGSLLAKVWDINENILRSQFTVFNGREVMEFRNKRIDELIELKLNVDTSPLGLARNHDEFDMLIASAKCSERLSSGVRFDPMEEFGRFVWVEGFGRVDYKTLSSPPERCLEYVMRKTIKAPPPEFTWGAPEIPFVSEPSPFRDLPEKAEKIARDCLQAIESDRGITEEDVKAFEEIDG